MCGRYVVTNAVTKTKNIVKTAINVQDSDNYNAHPYQNLPVVKKYKNGNTVENLKWGIIPSWAKQKDFKALINARLETIDEKISFKKLIKLTEVEKNERALNKETFYALSKYFTDIGEIKKGFMYLQKANTIRAKEVKRKELTASLEAGYDLREHLISVRLDEKTGKTFILDDI